MSRRTMRRRTSAAPLWNLMLLMGTILVGTPSYTAHAQEFQCEVTVNRQQVTGNAHDHVLELPAELRRYLNETAWTSLAYLEHERLRCSMQIILTSASEDYRYSARFVGILRRPVYNTMQQTQVLVVSDESWQFDYPRGKNLVRDDLQFDGLTSMIDFYVYVFLGYDFDSYSELGGSEWFNKAKTIQELGDAAGATGWSRAVGAQRNRFGMITDLTSPAMDEFRKAMYRYHRHGLDSFVEDQEASRNEVREALLQIQEAMRSSANPYLYDLFFTTKSQELVSIFFEAPFQLRSEIATLLKQINPGNSSQYDRLVN